MEYITKNEQETYELAYNFAKTVGYNAIICLNGEMGAGKTAFVKGFVKYFNIEDVSSPTFTIVNEYNTDSLDIFHFDVYRLTDIDEFIAIGGDEYFERGASIIEWGEIIEEVLPKDYIKVTFTRNLDEENVRNIQIDCFGNTNIEI